MKQLKRIAAVALTGAMALTMLAGCGGGSGSKRITDAVSLINVMLQVDGSDVTVKEDAALTKQAESYVELLSQAKEVPTSVADDPDNAEYYEARRYDQYVGDIEDHRYQALYNSNILVLDVGNYEFYNTDGWGSNDEQRASDLADQLVAYLDGEDTYGVGDEDVDLSGITITGIGIAEAKDVNRSMYADNCARHCGHVSEDEAYYRDNDWENNYFAHTQKFNGWIVLVSFTR